jgi:uncharacterized protein YndB with AHSA1/START domain
MNTIRLEQLLIQQPPELVWRALTEPDLHAKWWAEGDIQAVPGHRFRLDMGSWGQQDCEISAVERPHQLSYRFAIGTLDTTITWTLLAEAGKTRLLLEHDGFDLNNPLGQTAFAGMGRGWPSLLANIEAMLADELTQDTD